MFEFIMIILKQTPDKPSVGSIQAESHPPTHTHTAWAGACSPAREDDRGRLLGAVA